MKRKLFLLLCALLTMIGVQAETDYTNLMSDDWTGSSGNFGGGKERYQNANYTASEKVMYQSFTAPATGIYEIKFYAVTSSTSGRGFDNIYGPNIAQAYATAGSNKAVVAMEVINQTGCTLVEPGNIRTLSVEAAEGETIEYGLENIAKGGNWYTILKYTAKMKTVAEIFQAQYDEAYAIWEHSTENEVGARATFKGYVDALNTAMSGSLAEAQTASDNLAAQLVIYESKSYPVKGSGVKYDFTSKMNMAINAWTCAQGNGPAQYGFTGATETYGNTSAGKVMYQTISGLANGEYEIHFYGVANAANGGGVGGSKTYAYANDQQIEVDVITQNSCTPSDYERTITVMVTDGTIEYGFTNTEAAGNWYLCKNVALYMTGAPDLSDYYEAIAAKLITANSLKLSPMNSTVLSALQDAIDATEGYTEITVIGTLETLSDNLTTAINDANTSVSNYEEALSILNAASSLDAAGQASYAANETVSAIQTAYDARTLVSVSADQATACATALVTAAKAQTSAGADMTLAIANPNIDGNVDGWTTYMNANGGYVGGPLKPSGDAMEFWAAGTLTEQDHGKSFDYYQTITGLPTGAYTITAQMLNSTNGETGADWNGGGTSGLYGKSTCYEVQNLVTTDDETFRNYTTDEIFVVDGTLRLGVKNIKAMTGRWFAATGFKLTYVRQLSDEDKAAIKNDLNDAITAANSARKAENEGNGIFQIPATAGTTFASAISAAQSVYDNAGATLVEQTTAISTINAAVETYEATTLNAPEVGKRYCIVVATEGHPKNGLAVGIALGTTGPNNPTGYTINTSNTTNQSVAFTQVSGNSYNINFETAEGTTYLTYGTTNGSAAGWSDSQIQATTDADKKGNFAIIATNKANVFNIQNTITGSTIACQNGGNIYTEAGNADFTLVEATAANMAVNAEAKWGTFCAPFEVAIPEGVTAYTCESATGGVLNLTPQESTIPANTPVILNAEEGLASTMFYGKKVENESDDIITGGLLRGNVSTEAKVITYTGHEYLLQMQGGKTGFYKMGNSDTYKVGYNRCYLVESGSGFAREVFFFEGDDATAISEVEAVEAKAQGLKDGKYLINGRIVIVNAGKAFGANGQILK